jgi:hypothetical protein
MTIFSSAAGAVSNKLIEKNPAGFCPIPVGNYPAGPIPSDGTTNSSKVGGEAWKKTTFDRTIRWS